MREMRACLCTTRLRRVQARAKGALIFRGGQEAGNKTDAFFSFRT